jgi:uncharacterized protein YbaP (TraB family)
VRFVYLFWLVLAPASAVERGALFKVTANGHTMHLFGTIHVGLPQFYPLEPRITAALAGASALALEVDPDQPSAEVAQLMRKHGLLAEGERGYSSLAPAKRQQLELLVRQAGLDPTVTSAFKPTMLASLLSMVQYQKLGYDVNLGVDRFLARRARAGNVRVLELESLDRQLALLNHLHGDEQWRFLEETIDGILSGAEQIESRHLADAWANADRTALDALAEQVAADPTLSGRFMREVLLDGRNGALAAKLARLLASEQNTVAAMGVLHLVGKNSVPALLRARGFQVERLY